MGIKVKQDLGVAFGAEPIAGGAQSAAQFLVVINLAVEGYDETAVIGLHRLQPVIGQVDNGETAMGKSGASVAGDPDAAAVRAALGHVLRHDDQFGSLDVASAPVIGMDSRNAAHRSASIALSLTEDRWRAVNEARADMNLLGSAS